MKHIRYEVWDGKGLNNTTTKQKEPLLTFSDRTYDRNGPETV